MTTAAELREALNWQGDFEADIRNSGGRKWQKEAEAGVIELAKVCDAARFALQVWEGDEELVEKVAQALTERDLNEPLIELPDDIQNNYWEEARAVLAAITEEEQK